MQTYYKDASCSVSPIEISRIVTPNYQSHVPPVDGAVPVVELIRDGVHLEA